MSANEAGRLLSAVIVAEHASARFGGEAVLPLHYFRILRRRGHEAWLVVHERTRQELLSLFPQDSDHILFVADSPLNKGLWRLQRWLNLPPRIGEVTLGFINRLSTQIRARNMARSLVRRFHLDFVHQPIPVSPREPSLLFNMDAPVVIGPMNGGMTYPPGFLSHQHGSEDRFLRKVRFLSGCLHAVMPGKLRADLLLVANERTRESLPPHCRGRVFELVENGVDLSRWSVEPKNEADKPVRFVFSGRLVGWKGVGLLLKAFEKVLAHAPETRLAILGDGPERQQLSNQAVQAGIAERVEFLGWRSQEECAAIFQECQVLVLPSLRECGGAVVLEAMASGLPVIATAWGGPLDYVDERCGVLVPPTTPTEFVDGLAAAMVRLATEPQTRQAMGQTARAKAREVFDWEVKVTRFLSLVSDVIAARGSPSPTTLD